MKKKWEFQDSDVEFLQDINKMELALVAQAWAERMHWRPEKAEANARGMLQRIRMRVIRCQNYVNQIRALQKNSARIRKLTTSGQLQEPQEPDDF